MNTTQEPKAKFVIFKEFDDIDDANTYANLILEDHKNALTLVKLSKHGENDYLLQITIINNK